MERPHLSGEESVIGMRRLRRAFSPSGGVSFPRRVEIAFITNGGERLTHLYPNDCYYAHLSIYHFAVPLVCGRRVLDAGSGTGYGAAYLATHGAHMVYGVEVDPEAVAFSQRKFTSPNLDFQCLDLQKLTGFPAHSIDVVLSSNVLEHVPDVPAFLHAAWQVLTVDGVLVVAVPPITDAASRAHDFDNPYHLTSWSIRQWHDALGLFFAEVQYYRHFCGRPEIELDFANKPAQTVLRETDFAFEPLDLGAALRVPSLTAVFVARRPRSQAELPARDMPFPVVDDSFTRPAPPHVGRPGTAAVLRWLRRVRRGAAPPDSRREIAWFLVFRAAQIWHQRGPGTLLRKAATTARKQWAHRS